jgi:ribonuclease T2
MSKKIVLGFLLLSLICAGGALARSRKKAQSGGDGVPGQFDYYLLSMSWAPDFCDQPKANKNSRECGSGNRVGFIGHGLWPQYENGSYPKQCAAARPVADDIVTRMLPVMMDAGLVQHEWRDHGTCSGLATAAYFDLVTRAYQSVQVPAEYKNLNREIRVSPGEVHAKFTAANPGFPKDAFRVSCGGGELSEVRVCFTKDLKARACSVNDRDCSTDSLRMLPLR